MRKCSEVVSGGVRNVLEEDCVLGAGAEMRHAVVERRERDRVTVSQRSVQAARKQVVYAPSARTQ